MKIQKYNLPDDVVLIILSKLPVKTLMRCRCVSQEWKLFINNTHLINTHLHHSNTTKLSIIEGMDLTTRFPKLLLLRDESTIEDLELPFTRDKVQTIHNKYARIVVGCCNGLLCFNLSDTYTTILLWNPATRESRYLSEPKPVSTITKQQFVYYMSFGFDHINNDYKLVRITENSTFELQIQVFRQSTNDWRGVKGILGYRMLCYKMSHSYSVTVNGVLYLLAEHNTKNELNRCILQFNLCTEKFEEILDLPGKVEKIKLYQWKESFAMVEPTDLEYNFWIKNNGLPGWTKLFTISGCIVCDSESFLSGTWKDKLIFRKYNRGVFRKYDRGVYDKELENDRELTLLDAVHSRDYMNNYRPLKKYGIYINTFDYVDSLVSVNPP
ncbi:hypothetical protein UlMin_039477 [Ulmus minor]